MNLPFVSRLAYEDMKRSRDIERENAQALRREIMDLTDRLMAALKPVAPAATSQAPVEREVSKVTLAIREQAGDNPRLAAHFRALASKLKKQGKQEDEIVAAVESWVSTESDDFQAHVAAGAIS